MNLQAMASINSVTAPLAILFDDGSKKLAAECFEHKLGLLYLSPFWHLQQPQDAAHLIKGTLKGEGPWRIGNTTIRVLGCHNTDPDLQVEYQNWSSYLSENSANYPPAEQIKEIAAKLGALIQE